MVQRLRHNSTHHHPVEIHEKRNIAVQLRSEGKRRSPGLEAGGRMSRRRDTEAMSHCHMTKIILGFSLRMFEKLLKQGVRRVLSSAFNSLVSRFSACPKCFGNRGQDAWLLV